MASISTNIDAVRRGVEREWAHGDAGERAAVLDRALADLSDTLEPLLGRRGTEALVLRSVKLASSEHPSLAAALGDSGATEQPTVRARVVTSLSALAPVDASRAASDLFGRLLGLIITFIGEALVWQILKRTYPALAVDDDDSKESV